MLFMAVAFATPLSGSRRTNVQFGLDTSKNSSPQAETPPPGDASSLTDKVAECRIVLQQAGVGTEAEKPTEGQTEEAATEQPKPMTEATNKRSARKF